MKILIQVEGGIVRGICSDEPCDAEVFVLDYDIEDIYPDNIRKVPQSDMPGDTQAAYLDHHGKPGLMFPAIKAALREWELEPAIKAALREWDQERVTEEDEEEEVRQECISCCHEMVCKESLKKDKVGPCPFYWEDNY